MQRLPPLRLLAVFEAVQRHGSLQRAARELNVSPPAISQAIKGLEAHVGAALLDRATRPPRLTEAGALLHRAVSDGLGRIADAIAQIEALQNRTPGAVTVACSVGTATYWLMPRLGDLYRAHPDLSVHVRTTPQGAPELAPGVDLAIRYGLGDWADGAVVKLFEESVVPVCHPDLAVRGLAGQTLLHVDAGEANWLGWADYAKRAGIALPPGKERRFTNYVQATQAALAGQGVMLGWSSNTGDLLAEGSHVACALPRIQPAEAFWLVLATGRASHPEVRRLAGWLGSDGAPQALR